MAGDATISTGQSPAPDTIRAQLAARAPGALRRLRALPWQRRATDAALADLAGTLGRDDCRALIAAECGFRDWPHAAHVLSGDDVADDAGDLLRFTRHDHHVSGWYTRYDEAAAVREQTNGFPLAYRRQFIVADRQCIRALDLDPDDPDWAALGFDWACPRGQAARVRPYAKLLAALPPAEPPRSDAARLAVYAKFAARRRDTAPS